MEKISRRARLKGLASAGWPAEKTLLRACFAVLPVVFLFLSGCGRSFAARDEWTIIAVALPEKVTLENIKVSIVGYLIRQTHEPLFRHEDGQNYTSRILSSWSRSLDYRDFRFCPDQALKFDEKKRFTQDFLAGFLERITGRDYPEHKISAASGCVTVSFPSSQPGYLQFLSKYATAPSIENEGGSLGLGPFRVLSVSKDRVELGRKEPVKRGYNKITVYPYEAGSAMLNSRSISDFNMLPPGQKPQWLEDEYRGLYNVELKMVGLAINHPDKGVRKALYNCTDINGLRVLISPQRKEFYDIATALPLGVPGAKSGLPVQGCSAPAGLRGTRIVYANPRKEKRDELAAYMEGLSGRTGFKIEIKDYKQEEMNPMLLDRRRRKPFSLVVVAAGSSDPQQDAFFDFFVGENVVLDYVPDALRRAFLVLRKESDPSKKKVIAEKLADDLGSQALFLPLYQSVAKMYYPPEIRNLYVGRGFLESPDVGDLRW